MQTGTEPLVPDSAAATAIGVVGGIMLGGPIGGITLGAIGLYVGLRLDEIRTLRTEVEELQAELENRGPAMDESG